MASEQTRNENTGSVRGSLVQARTIVGDLHFHHHPRNRGPRWGAASALGLALLFGAAVLVRHGWWPVAVLLLAAGGLLEWWLISRAIRLGGPDTSPDAATSELRRQVRDQWAAERDNRGLQEPRPLRLRWRPTQRPVQVKLTAAEKGRAELRRGELLEGTDESRPAAAALLTAFRQSPRRQLVVLGERGAGKSTLALLFTLAALDDEEQPVPVLLSVAGWDPGERIEDWIARKVSEEYPAVSRPRAARLLADKQLLPVLDGLDEIPSELRGRALAALNRSAPRMVITCRSAEFQAAVTTDGVLAHAAVVEIEPIRPEDARDFFEQRDVEGARRWDRVIDAVVERPDGPLAELLSSPLMISLARRVYRRPSSRPEELVEFDTAAAARRHLLAEFLPAIYPDDRYRAKAERWLAFLAHHLVRLGDPNYEWWHLVRSVPRWVVPTIVALPVALPATLSVSLMLGELTPVHVVSSLSLGVMVGAHAGRIAPRAGAPLRHSVLTLLGGVVLDLATMIAAFCTAGLAFFLVADLAGSNAGKNAILRLSEYNSTDDGILSLYAGVVLVVGIVSYVLSADRAGIPRRSLPRLATLLPSFATGMATGLVLVLPVAVPALLDGEVDGFQEVLTAVVVLPAVFGVPVGVARWLAAPDHHEVASSPGAVLRRDRTALLVTAVAGGATMAGLVAVLPWAIGTPPDSGSELGGVVLAAGYISAVVVLFCSGGVWIPYTVARFWLAVRGRLPWRLTAFLRDAHAAGVLRQNGAAYQLRHDVLREYLAERHPGHSGAYPPPGTAVRRKTAFRCWWPGFAAVGAAASLAAFSGVLVLLLPAGTPRGTWNLGRDGVYSLYFSHFAMLGGSADVALALDWPRETTRGVDLRTGRLFELPYGYREYSSATSADGSLLATLRPGETEVLEVRETSSGSIVSAIPVGVRGGEYDYSVQFVEDGTVVAVLNSADQIVRFWDVRTARPVREVDASALIPNQAGDVYSMWASPPGPDSVLGLDTSGGGWRWNYETGEVTQAYTDPCSESWCEVLAAAEGGPVVVDRNENVIRMSNGKELHVLDVVGLANSPSEWTVSEDGRTLFTFYQDGEIRAWPLPGP